MKASEQQRLELALQAAANIAPIQFHIRFSRFSPAIFAKRVWAAVVVYGVILLISCWGLKLALSWSILLGLGLAYGFYHSPIAAMIWSKVGVSDDTFRQHNLLPKVSDEGQSQIIIDASMFPRTLFVHASADLSDIEELATLAVELQSTLTTDGPTEAIIKAVELSLLAVLPIAATLPSLRSASTVNVVR